LKRLKKKKWKKNNILGPNEIHCADEWLVIITQSSNDRLAEIRTKPERATIDITAL
jgi:hypothetical protein